MAGPIRKGSLLAKRYRLLDSLGRGGMGVVWHARDEVLGREVAVKEVLLPPELPEEEQAVMRERTLREARSAARLSHPNVVTVYDVVEEDGRPWIVMELVKSRTLAQAIRDDGPLPWREVALIGVQVLEALQAAHAAGVLHRDVKPSNVLLAEDGRVVLTDFGIASMEGETTLTRTGMLVGSPAFIAPERVRARGAGPESDLWSLGATLYTAVEGRPPHDRGAALPTLTAAVTEAPDPAPSAGPLWPAIDGLLRKEPAERFTADEASRLLQHAIGSAAVQPAPPAAAAAGGMEDSGQRTRVLPVPPISAAPAAGSTPSASAAAEPAVGGGVAGNVPPSAGAGPGTSGEFSVDSATGAAAGGAAATAAGGGAPPAAPDSWTQPAPASTKTGTPARRVGLVVLACLVVVGAVVGWVLRPTDDDPGNQTPQAGQSTSTTPRATGSSSPAPSASTTTTKSSATPAPTTSKPAATTSRPPTTTTSSEPPATGVPAGFRRHTDSSGFSLLVPAGWSVGRDGQQVSFREPGGSRLLLIDQTDQPKEDPVADWRQQEQSRRGGYTDYQRIRIEAVDYFDKAADWEFTYAARSGRQHVLIRGAVTSDDQAYGIYWSTPESQWDASRALLRTITDSFRPAS
ncbi:hypothetical protein BWI15_16825 [Kribbella sp. ALI-6-A]|uniref:serine/threonine-protein kinase n=1 Tax=Kribbella sp. ALI-6-A TaxID=1933817 RepID=UPI00097C25F9|nr:serine/threonine-protein kinase [Kribbella sp. ALI-6-A]ONI71797.1 hypothetical protein BWI15_16825 [Kribbella sp. ALI-6-A]